MARRPAVAKPSDMFYGYNNNHASAAHCGGGASVSGQPDDMVQSWIESLPALQDLSQVKSKATPPERSDSFSAPTSGSGSPVVVGGGRRALAFSKLSVVVPATCTNITRDQEDIIELREEEANFLAAARGEVGAPAGQEQPKGGAASKSPRAWQAWWRECKRKFGSLHRRRTAEKEEGCEGKRPRKAACDGEDEDPEVGGAAAHPTLPAKPTPCRPSIARASTGLDSGLIRLHDNVPNPLLTLTVCAFQFTQSSGLLLCFYLFAL